MHIKKIIFWAIAIFVVVGIGTGTYLYINAQNIINEIIREQIIDKNNNREDAKYHITLEKIRLNLLNGSFKLINLTITPKDSLVAVKNNLNKKVYRNTTLDIQIDEIALKGFDYLKALNERVLVAESFKILRPQLKIYQHQGIAKDEDVSQDTVDIRHIFLAEFDTFRIQEISVINASTYYFSIDSKEDTTQFFLLDHMSYQIWGIVANKETLFSNQIITYDSYLLKSRNIGLQLPNGSQVKIGSIDYNSDENQLQIGNVDFEQNGNPTKFFRSLKYRKSWMKVTASNIIIDQFDFDNWLDNDNLHLPQLTVTKPKLTIYSNANIPFDSTDIKPMLGEMIMKIPVPFKIDKVIVDDAVIKLDMIGKVTETHGLLTFHKMNIEASNVTNRKQDLKLDEMMIIKASTKINKTGRVNATIRINLKSPSSITTFDVEAFDLKLKNFNSVLKPILRVSIKAGNMRYMKINSVISTLGGMGTMNAHYTNLKLQLESKELSENPGIFNKMASGMANGVLKTENLPENKSYHEGNFEFKKHPTDSFFKMLWLVSLNGLEDSILGSDKRDQRRVKKQQRQKNNSKSKFSLKKKIKIFK